MLEELLKAEENLRLALEKEEATGHAIDSMERRYWEGYVEALGFAVAQQIKVGA